MTLAISLALAVATGACAKDETKRSTLTTSTSLTTGTGGSGAGGSSGTGGTGGSGGSTSTSGTAGGGGIPVSDVACTGDYAFRAAGMSFTPPTAGALGQAFNELAYDFEVHPITVVLRATDPQQATIAASSTMYDPNTYMDSFVAGLDPTFTDAGLAQGAFWTGTPQATGYLRLRHDQGVLDLELTNLTVHATTDSDCNQAFVTLDAIIPVTEKSKQLVYSGGTTTVGDLGGGDPNNPLPLRALFLTEAISLDWASLDP